MKDLVLTFVVVMICIVGFKFANIKDKTTNFTITADTNISKNSQLSKYVTQQEIDGFALRHWNIANEDNHYDENETQKALRHLLEARQTDKVLEFLKDNNLSVDTKLQANTTPLMYSAFYNDENTTKELIKLGANIRAKDSYKLSPMAYAIGNNSIETVKILLENGVKFDEVDKVQTYAKKDNFLNGIDFIEIDDNNKTIIHIKRQHITKPIQNEDEYHVFPAVMFEYIVENNLIDMAKLALENGYKPYTYNYTNSDGGIEVSNVFEEIVSADEVIEHGKFKKNRNNEKFNLETDFEFYADELKFDLSLYRNLRYDNYEPMLDLLLEHNISGQPSQKFMKNIYDDWCYDDYKRAIREKVYYLAEMRQGVDKYAEELTTYQYAKKHNMKWKADRSELDILRQLLKDKIIVRTPKEPTPYIVKLLDENIERHAKYCGDKDLDFERDLVNWNDEIFGMAQQYHALFKWEDKPIPEMANFKDIKDFIGFLSEFYKPDRDIGLAIIKDTNLTYNEYIDKIVDKQAQTLTEKIKFGNKSKQELIELKHWFYN